MQIWCFLFYFCSHFIFCKGTIKNIQLKLFRIWYMAWLTINSIHLVLFKHKISFSDSSNTRSICHYSLSIFSSCLTNVCTLDQLFSRDGTLNNKYLIYFYNTLFITIQSLLRIIMWQTSQKQISVFVSNEKCIF